MIRRVVVGVSGGVDSCVSAHLLKQKGFEVQGVFMKNWDTADEKGVCSADKDAEYASYACKKLGIPFSEANFVKEYWNDVFSPLVQGYLKGISPNPDILCNKYIKFGYFFDHAVNVMGADAVATGHYARNSFGQFLEHSSSEGAKLLKSYDSTKDQTLFLSQISQKSLQKAMFPIGNYLKHKVKEIAHEIGLELIAKRKEYAPQTKGLFIDLQTGVAVGEHEGVHLWTIGQRVPVGGLSMAYFVAERDAQTQIIKVVQGTSHPALFSENMITEPPHWINENPFLKVKQLKCQFRFQHVYAPVDCEVTQNEDKTLEIQSSVPMRAITAGQYATFYQGEECLGSASILKSTSPYHENCMKSKHVIMSR